MNKRSLNAQIATILRKKDISNLNLQIEANRKKGFSLSLELGKLIHTIHDGMSKANFSDFVAKALSDYESESDKKAISDGLKEVRENFFGRGEKNTPWEYFGMGKSWYYRVKKSAMHSSELVEKFLKETDETSVDALNRFAIEENPEGAVKKKGKSPKDSAKKKKTSSSSEEKGSPSSPGGQKVVYDLTIGADRLSAYLKFKIQDDHIVVENHHPEGEVTLDLLTKVNAFVSKAITQVQQDLLDSEAKKSA